MAYNRPHKNLDAWIQSMDMVRNIYEITTCFPESERFGLIPQMRRASISIPSNIAEGAARKGKKEFDYFLNIAQGSISELDTQVELATMLNYIDKDAANALSTKLDSISKMVFGLSRSLKQ